MSFASRDLKARRWPLSILVGLLLCAGCAPAEDGQSGSSQTGAAGSPGAPAMPSLATPSPSPTAAPHPSDLPLEMPEFRCRIPIASTVPKSSGYVDVPGGALTPDPAAQIYHAAGGGQSYVASLQHWVPVRPALVNFNAGTYADVQYVAPNTELAIRDAGTDALRARYVLPTATAPISYTADGVYAAPNGNVYGLWFWRVGTARFTRITDGGTWEMVSGDYAYGVTGAQGQLAAANVLGRLNLRTGVVDEYFRPDVEGHFIGSDSTGRPLVVGRGVSRVMLWALNGPGQAELVFAGDRAQNPENTTEPFKVDFSTVAVTDHWGTWIGSSRGMVLYAGGRLHRVSDAVGQPAGPCV